MWSENWGFVVTEQEIARNHEMKKRRGYAPDLYCPNCKGYGFAHPIVADRVEFETAMPCPTCLPDQHQKFLSNRYMRKEN